MNLLKKRFLSESVIFQGLSFGHFRQPGPESSASQNGVSTSSLPPLIVDLLTYLKITQGPTCFLMGNLESVQWKTSQADYNGPKKQCSLTYSHMFQVRHNPTGGALTEEMKLIFIEACKTWAGSASLASSTSTLTPPCSPRASTSPLMGTSPTYPSRTSA